MELEFLNTEPDFDFSWLPADIEQPDSIASEGLQTAINAFCDETREFLCSRCPEYAPQIKAALRHGRPFREIYIMTHDCPKQLKDLAETIADWIGEVFYYQLVEGALEGTTFEPEPETKKLLRHPEIYDIPRRLAAMRRLRESWSKIAPHSGIEAVRRECQIDMRDWDRKAAA